MVYGKLRILHWGPLLALGVIGTISMSTVSCVIQWWPPFKTSGGLINLLVYAFWNIATLYNFLNAIYIGPGWVPEGWQPETQEETMYLQYCTFCEAYKAPRSHHCRKCEKCVMKMDHHCPWINNCVGHRNHKYFCLFLFWAPMGCIHSLFILIPALYRAINRTHYYYLGDPSIPLVNLGIYHFVFAMFAIGLSIGVIFAVGGLLCVQLRSVIKNETGIEGWIKDKATYRDREEGEEEFVFPYYLGKWKNFRMVFHWRDRPQQNGIWWPVREGAHQYTLTIEQIKQKKDKRDKSVVYRAVKVFSGSLLAISHGCRVCCCPPCTDEPRIPLCKGDHILVSRWKRHWLYGDKILDQLRTNQGDNAVPKRVRGWFPRRCAEEILKDFPEASDPHTLGSHVPGSHAPSSQASGSHASLGADDQANVRSRKDKKNTSHEDELEDNNDEAYKKEN